MDIIPTDLAQKCWEKPTAFICQEHSKRRSMSLKEELLLCPRAPSMGLGGVHSSQAEQDIKHELPSELQGGGWQCPLPPLCEAIHQLKKQSRDTHPQQRPLGPKSHLLWCQTSVFMLTEGRASSCFPQDFPSSCTSDSPVPSVSVGQLPFPRHCQTQSKNIRQGCDTQGWAGSSLRASALGPHRPLQGKHLKKE